MEDVLIYTRHFFPQFFSTQIIYRKIIQGGEQQSRKKNHTRTFLFGTRFRIGGRCSLQLQPRTCAFKLAGPHALARRGALGTVGRLTAGLRAVAGEEDVPLVDAAVVLRHAAHRAADAGPLWTVGAPLALQGRLGGGEGTVQLLSMAVYRFSQKSFL